MKFFVFISVVLALTACGERKFFEQKQKPERPAPLDDAIFENSKSVCVAENGNLTCYGKESIKNNQLFNRPIPEITDPIKSFSMGENKKGAASCAVTIRNKLHCWYNDSGQEFTQYLPHFSEPIKEVAISIRDSFEIQICLINLSDEIKCFDLTQTQPSPPFTDKNFPNFGIRKLFLNNENGCVMYAHGLGCWFGEAQPFPGDFKDFTLDDQSTLCAVRENNTITCSNQNGQMTEVKTTGFGQIKRIRNNFCILNTAGKLKCFNPYSKAQALKPQDNLERIIDWSGTCALTESKKVNCDLFNH
jgi:hypothetical protein